MKKEGVRGQEVKRRADSRISDSLNRLPDTRVQAIENGWSG